MRSSTPALRPYFAASAPFPVESESTRSGRVQQPCHHQPLSASAGPRECASHIARPTRESPTSGLCLVLYYCLPAPACEDVEFETNAPVTPCSCCGLHKSTKRAWLHPTPSQFQYITRRPPDASYRKVGCKGLEVMCKLFMSPSGRPRLYDDALLPLLPACVRIGSPHARREKYSSI